MTDQNRNDSEFERYLEGKSSLSELYAQSQSGGPSKQTDEAILHAARQKVEQHESASSNRGFHRYVPLALAASLVIAIFVVSVVPLDDTSETDMISKTTPPADSKQHVGAGKATPELMLEKMNTLVAEGKEKEALEEYRIFLALFPNHEIDFQKYPHLKKLPTE